MIIETTKPAAICTYNETSRNMLILLFIHNWILQLLLVGEKIGKKAVARITTLPLHFVIWP